MSLTVHDISVPCHPEMLHYGRRPEKTMVESIAAGDPGNVSRWLIGSHTGTHVDAPAHFVEGAPTIESVPLDVLVGPAVVLDLTFVSGHEIGRPGRRRPERQPPRPVEDRELHRRAARA